MTFKKDLVALRPRLYRFALSLVRSPDRAEDLTQATLERAFTRSRQYVPGTNLKAWLFRIAQNILISEYRRNREYVVDADTIALVSERRVQPATQEAHMCLLEIQKCVDARNDSDSNRLLHLLIEGYSYEEIAQIEGLSHDAAKARIARLRAHVRQALNIDNQRQFLNDILFR